MIKCCQKGRDLRVNGGTYSYSHSGVKHRRDWHKGITSVITLYMILPVFFSQLNTTILFTLLTSVFMLAIVSTTFDWGLVNITFISLSGRCNGFRRDVTSSAPLLSR